MVKERWVSNVSGSESSSQLDWLIEQSRQQGQVESEGHFTMDRDKALDKLAKFQLPFEGAWALKIIQSIVATGESEAIRVELNWKETRFTFDSDSWSLDEIETEFFQVDEDRDSPYADLARGLWPVALGEHRTFSLSLPGQLEALVWNGERLIRADLESLPEVAVLSVALFPSPQGRLDEVKALANYSARNELLHEVIKRHCFTCPIPLTLDYDRIDALLDCPRFGINERSLPLFVDSAPCELPSLRIPPGTKDRTVQRRSLRKLVRDFFSTRHDEFGVEKLWKDFLNNFSPVEETELPYLVSFRMKFEKTSGWNQLPGRSALYWVKHGVVVDQDPLNDALTLCSLGCFANGDDLPTDLTGLRLRQTVERQSRLAKARGALYVRLGESAPTRETVEPILGASRHGKTLGAFSTAIGLVAAFVVPGLGIPIMAIGGTLWGGKYRQEKKVRRLSEELNILTRSLSPP